jgi:hypothetical protein
MLLNSLAVLDHAVNAGDGVRRAEFHLEKLIETVLPHNVWQVDLCQAIDVVVSFTRKILAQIHVLSRKTRWLLPFSSSTLGRMLHMAFDTYNQVRITNHGYTIQDIPH